MWFNKKKAMPELSPSEFLSTAILRLHDDASKKGFANKGFIFHEGLLEMGNSFISEGLKSRPLHLQDESFYYSLATSNLQTGFVLARQACINKESLLNGSFFESHADVESMYQELVVGLQTDLNISFKEWENFRNYIIPTWSDIIRPYQNSSNLEAYKVKLLVAYYTLGISIGLEKYEP